MAAATGTYLLFLDGDDVLVPGALAALDTKLHKDVDVLYFEHERVHWWEGEPSTPPLDKDPRVIGVQVPAFSAAYRRAFLAEHQLVFPEGHFTDAGWGGLVALAAERADVLRSVCVRHHLRRQGSRLNTPGEHQLELLDQVELVLTRAIEQRLPAARLRPLFEHLFAVVLKTAAHPERLPARLRRAFFRRAGRLYRRHRPAGFRPPSGSLGVQHRLLAAGAYSAFRALRGANQAAERATSLMPGPARRARGMYAAYLRRPIDENLAVYCAYWGRGYACNPAAIHSAAQRLAPHIRSVFLVTEDAVEHLPKDIDHAVIGSRRYWEVLARAKYLVNNANFEGAVVKRPGTVHLSTQHGTPLKKMGIEQAEYPVVAAATGSFDRLLSRADRWDYNLSSNRLSTEVWERSFPSSYEMLEYGYPRNDVYYTSSASDVHRIRKQLGVPEGRTALLYAPTHRDYHTGFNTQLDLKALCDALGDDFVVLLRAHYFYDGDQGHLRDERIIDVTAHRSSEDVCLAADALITDYSSIVFDYANLDRPIVVYADDWDVYRETRGVTFDFLGSPPGPVARTADELAAVFRSGSWAGAESAALRARFRARFCEFDDGRAADRVVRRVLLGEPAEAIEPPVPLAHRTPAPAAVTIAVPTAAPAAVTTAPRS
jgi:CDP-glycerol glycerophosphotransferase (TagB/SpsB family)